MDKNYHAYLVRFKRRAAQSSWRATLEDVHTRETLTFVTERELLVHILHVLSEHPNPTDTNADAEDESDQTRLRSSVQNVHTGEQSHFSDRGELMRFLERSLFGRKDTATEMDNESSDAEMQERDSEGGDLSSYRT